jgi:hypothetical protein
MVPPIVADDGASAMGGEEIPASTYFWRISNSGQLEEGLYLGDGERSLPVAGGDFRHLVRPLGEAAV